MSRRKALLIGTDHYEASDLADLKTPCKNLRDLDLFLRDPKIGCFDEVITLSEPSLPEAQSGIAHLFADKRRDDLVLLYFAGHGLKDDSGSLYLALGETRQGWPEMTYTAIVDHWIKALMNESRSQRIVLILDCCFSGAFGAGAMASVVEPLGIREAFAASGHGRVVLTASDETRYAWEEDQALPGSSNSVFTHFLLEGLRDGNADLNRNGEITVDELFEYAYNQIARHVPKQKPQRFKLKDDPQDLIIALNPFLTRLDSQLELATRNPDPWVRNGAIGRLAELTQQAEYHPELAAEARAVLNRLAGDPSPMVTQAAERALERLCRADDPPVEPASAEVRRLRVLVAAPEDIDGERAIIRRTINALNRDPDFHQQIYFELLSDPNAAAEEMTRATGDLLSLDEHDLVLVLFWAHMGIPLPESDLCKDDGTPYLSLVEWTYRDARAREKASNHPTVRVYRRTEEPFLSPRDPEILAKIKQFQLVEKFYQGLRRDRASGADCYSAYASLEELAELLAEDLYAFRETQAKTSGAKIPKASEEAVDEEKDDLGVDAVLVLAPYLDWLIRIHSRLELRGVREAKAPTVPIEKVYVALKGDRTNVYERSQAHKLIKVDLHELIAELDEDEMTAGELAQEVHHLKQQLLTQNPIMPSISERDRPEAAGADGESVNLGEAFRHERCLVILGDPGSGKTTLVRWLTVKLARALSEDHSRVQVPAQQVEPEAAADDSVVDLGPARLPVMLRISDYAEAYSVARGRNETLPLVEYLGSQPWLGQRPTHKGEEISPRLLNLLIKDALRHGQAVVLLDGMDEITSSDDRDDIVRAIEIFIEDWIHRRHRENMSFQAAIGSPVALFDLVDWGDPADIGGNQIVITSRIAGYHASPIQLNVTHVTVEPMSRVAVEHFCDSWTMAVHQVTHPGDGDEGEGREQAAHEAEALKRALYDPARPRIRELASNPLLVTILAIVHRNRGQLPQQRAALYQLAMEILIEDWRKTGLSAEELAYVLAPLAAHIHQNIPSGLINENDLRELVTCELAALRKADPENITFHRTVNEFLRAVREDVGLLAARGESLYGFLHLTFQEYLAALALIRSKKRAAGAIVDRLNDPRWREPVLLALGYVGSRWGRESCDRLLLDLLEADDPLGDLLPRTPLLIISALDEMPEVSPQIIQRVARRLLVAYADRDGLAQFEKLREQVESSFTRLRTGRNIRQLDQILAEVLIDPPATHPDLAPAAARLILEQGWITEHIVQALCQALDNDLAAWEWPIHRAMRKVVTPPLPLPEPKPSESLATADWQMIKQNDIGRYYELKRRYAIEEATFAELKARYNEQVDRPPPELPSRLLPFREALLDENNESLHERIRTDPEWLRLVISLYGGYYDYDAAETLNEFKDIAYFLGLSESAQEAEIRRDREYYIGRWGAEDPIYQARDYLETGMAGRLDRAKTPPQFAYEAVYHDSPLTPRLLGALRKGTDARGLKPQLWKLWRHSPDPKVQADALIGLAALGIPILPELEEAFASHERSALATRVLDKLSLLHHNLADPAIRSLTDQEWLNKTLCKQLDSFSADRWIDLFHTLVELHNTYARTPFDAQQLLKNVPNEGLPYVLAEYWVCSFRGSLDDPVYRWAVATDGLLELDHQDLIAALGCLHQTRNSTFEEYLADWPVEPIPPRPDDSSDIPLNILEAIGNLRSEQLRPDLLNATASQFLKGLLPIIEANLDLLPEMLLFDFENRHESERPLAKLAPEFSGYLFPWEEFRLKVKNIGDPYYRARALLRWARVSPSERLMLVQRALTFARKIDDPHRRCSVLEHLLPRLPNVQQELPLKEALAAADAVTDPDQRARALARLARRLSGKQQHDALRRAIISAGEIVDSFERAETLQLLLKVPSLDHESLLHARGLARQITNPSHRDKALGLRGHSLFAIHDALVEADDREAERWAPLILGALTSDVLGYFQTRTGIDGLWLGLLEEPKGPVADQLFEMGIVAGLTLTHTATRVLDELLENGHEKHARRFFPLLQSPSAEAEAVVEHWLDHWDDFVAHHAALFLAEKGRHLTPDNIPQLAALVSSDEDRSRLRASLVLHGPQTGTREASERIFRASENDHHLFYAIAASTLRYQNRLPSVALVLKWFWHDVHFDDPNVIEEMVREIVDGGEYRERAEIVLGNIESVSAEALVSLLKAFRSRHPVVQSCVFKAICKICFHPENQSLPKEAWTILEEFSGEFGALATSELLDKKILFDTPLYIVASITDRCNSAKANSVTEVREIVDSTRGEFLGRLGDKILENDFNLRQMAQNVGATFYVQDENQTLAFGKMIEEVPLLFPMILEWLESLLLENIRDDTLCRIRGGLLELAAAGSIYQPATFANLAGSTRLGQILPEVAQHHNSYPGRYAAIILMSYLRRMMPQTLHSLRAALRDVEKVRRETLEAVPHFRKFDPEILPLLFAELYSRSATVAYAAAQLLAALGRSDKTTAEQRKAILIELAQAVRDPRSRRGLYEMQGSGWVHKNKGDYLRVSNRTRLDQEIYRALIQLVGTLKS